MFEQYSLVKKETGVPCLGHIITLESVPFADEECEMWPKKKLVSGNYFVTHSDPKATLSPRNSVYVLSNLQQQICS